MAQLPDYLQLPPVAQGVIAISAVALAIGRLLTASRPFWAWEWVPVWVQKLLPALLMAVAALPTAIEHARNWLDVVVGFVVTGAMWFTASRGDKRPSEDKDGGPRTERVNSDPKLPPGGGAVLLALLCGALVGSPLLLAACGSPVLTTKRCSFQNPAYSLHVAECRQRIEAECLLNPDNTPVDSCPALRECEKWRREQCQ